MKGCIEILVPEGNLFRMIADQLRMQSKRSPYVAFGARQLMIPGPCSRGRSHSEGVDPGSLNSLNGGREVGIEIQMTVKINVRRLHHRIIWARSLRP